MLRLPLLLALVVGTFAHGCAPATAYRRTALVPTPGGDTLTQPLHRRAEASLTAHVTDIVTDPFPTVGDSALQATRTTFTGQARFRIGEHLRLGGQFLYSHASLAQETTSGTPPMEGESVFGIGPQISAGWGGERWHIGFGGSLTFTTVPWATWMRLPGAPDSDFDGAPITDHYAPLEGGRDLMMLFTLSAGATFIASEWFEGFGGFSIQNALTNIGFDDQDRTGSTLSADRVGIVPFVGATFRVPEPGLFVRGQYYYPINFGHMTAGHAHWGGFAVTIGVQLGELREREHAHAPAPYDAPTYAPAPHDALAPPPSQTAPTTYPEPQLAPKPAIVDHET